MGLTKNQNTGKQKLIVYAAVFGGLGTLLLASSFSFSNRITLEAEDSVLSGAVTVRSDAQASGDAGIEFGVPVIDGDDPGPNNTGFVRAGLSAADLTPSGTITTTSDGQIIEGLDIQGIVKIEHDNVTIRNSRIQGSPSTYILNSTSNTGLLIENVTMVGIETTVRCSAVLLVSDATIRYSNLSGCRDVIKPRTNVLVEHSYIHSPFGPPGHNDHVQAETGSNITFRNNTFEDGPTYFHQVLFFQNNFGPLTNITLEDNLIINGQKGVSIDDRSSSKPYPPPSNISIRNNRFTGIFTQGYIFIDPGSDVSRCGNRVIDTNTDLDSPC